MTQPLEAAVKIKNDMLIIKIADSIVKLAAIHDGTLFKQELTPEGDILLKRLEERQT